jgi:hypothetical protein
MARAVQLLVCISCIAIHETIVGTFPWYLFPYPKSRKCFECSSRLSQGLSREPMTMTYEAVLRHPNGSYINSPTRDDAWRCYAVLCNGAILWAEGLAVIVRMVSYQVYLTSVINYSRGLPFKPSCRFIHTRKYSTKARQLRGCFDYGQYQHATFTLSLSGLHSLL